MLGPEAEQRTAQSDYAGAASAAFAPRDAPGDPRLVLAEAGTGTGKTLGYLAPATVWAEKNRGPVWISTFTRHLQRQIEDIIFNKDPMGVPLHFLGFHAVSAPKLTGWQWGPIQEIYWSKAVKS